MRSKVNYIKQNSLNMLTLILILFIILFSFYQYFRDYYSYAPKYYEKQEECKKTKNEYICKIAKSIEDPIEKFKKLDAITLTCEIVEHHAFYYMQLLSPLFIIILAINKIHKEISSGMFKNYLTRISYKKYLKQILLESLKTSMILPLSLLLVFLISCIITNFNFNVDSSVKMIAVYEQWKYSNFFLYGFTICIIQFFMSIFYGNIGLICCKKNKSKIITILLSYIVLFIIDIIIYVVLYALIINNVFGYHNLSRYFNILGYWFFGANTNYVFVILMASSLAMLSYLALYLCYKNKERLMIACEKENI